MITFRDFCYFMMFFGFIYWVFCEAVLSWFGIAGPLVRFIVWFAAFIVDLVL